MAKLTKSKCQINPIIKKMKESGSDGVVTLKGYIGDLTDSLVDVYPSLDTAVCWQIPEAAIVNVIEGSTSDELSTIYVVKGTKVKQVREITIGDDSSRCDSEVSFKLLIGQKPGTIYRLEYDSNTGGYIIVEVPPPEPPPEPPLPPLPPLNTCEDRCAARYGSDTAEYLACVTGCRRFQVV